MMEEENAITLHYELRGGHEVNGVTLAKSILAMETIAKEMAGIIAPKSNIQMIVSPPEEGSFKVVTWFILGALSSQIIPEIGTGIAKELSGSEKPFQDFGRTIVKQVTAFTSDILETPVDDIEKTRTEDPSSKANTAKDKAIKAKSDLFKSCLNDRNIKGVKFSPLKKSITKNEFRLHILTKKKKRKYSSLYWNVEAEIIQASTARNVNRQWGLRPYKGNKKNRNKNIDAHMEDQDFLTDFHNGKHPLRERDTTDVIHARIEIVRILEDGIIKEVRKAITKVYSFNGEWLADEIPIPSDGDSEDEPFELS